MNARLKLWCVVYQTGGTDNAVWQRTVPFTSRDTANEVRDDVARGGRVARVVDYHASLSIGLPDGYRTE